MRVSVKDVRSLDREMRNSVEGCAFVNRCALHQYLNEWSRPRTPSRAAAWWNDSDFGFWVSDFGFRVSGFGFGVSVTASAQRERSRLMLYTGTRCPWFGSAHGISCSISNNRDVTWSDQRVAGAATASAITSSSLLEINAIKSQV